MTLKLPTIPCQAGISLLILCLLVLSMPATAQVAEDDLLPPDQAFAISASLEGDTAVVRWQIADEYYMYRHALGFSAASDGFTTGEPLVPEGQRKTDEFFGEVETYRDELVVRVPLRFEGQPPAQITLAADSQGCADVGVCYPPQRQTVTLQITDASPAVSGSAGLDGVLGQIGNPGGTGLVDDGQALSPEDAFTYEAIELNAGTLLVRFTPAPGYYLYRDKFEFTVTAPAGFAVRDVELPEGRIKDDPEFGPVPVYFESVEIPVRLSRPAGEAATVTLQADFQGCRDGDICYPPMQRSVDVQVPAAAAAIGAAEAADETSSLQSQSSPALPGAARVQTEQDRLAALLVDTPWLAMLLFFLIGIALAFTPCVFPMVPILAGIIAGQGDTITTRRAFWLSVIYVLAMAVTYTVAGVIAGLFGQNLQALFQDPWIITAFVLIFVLLALSMFGFYELQLPSRLQTRLNAMSNRQSGGSLVGVVVMGVLSALIVGPCVAPALAAALLVIGQSGSPALGGGALFAMALGMGVPLVVFGTSAGKLLPRAGSWMNVVKAVFGVGLLALAIWMLDRIVPGTVILLLWGLLAVVSGIYMGAFRSRIEAASGWQRLWQGLGLALVILGAAELIGAAAGGEDWTEPLAPFAGSGAVAGAEASAHSFQMIKSADDLQQVLADNPGRTVMLDFYADWCVECKRMEKNTFNDPGVQAALGDTLWLQADVTAYDETDAAFLKQFDLIGPPAILFFDETGGELRHRRMIGYMGPEEFTRHVQQTF